jgi:hypothetical protein
LCLLSAFFFPDPEARSLQPVACSLWPHRSLLHRSLQIPVLAVVNLALTCEDESSYTIFPHIHLIKLILKQFKIRRHQHGRRKRIE